ncbi:MAG: pitrilysin family protein [bacterium]
MKIKQLKLNNGLKVVLAPLAGTKAVTVLTLLPVGSRFERAPIAGVSHLIEHIMFKGTKKRPNTLAISRELDSIGAEYNAFTSKDYTGYYVKADSRKIGVATDLLSDMLFNSVFDEKELNQERRVIVEELRMYKENPMMYIEDLFEELIYQGNALGRDIGGSQQTVLKMKYKEILEFKDAFYEPANMSVIIAGCFDEQKAVKLLGNYFQRDYSKTKKPKLDPYRVNQSKARVRIDRRKTEQTQLCLGVPAYAYQDKKMAALKILAIILGGNMSSRLFINIRDKLGLAYYIRTGLGTHADTGCFYIRAGLDKIRTEEGIIAIMKELQQLKKSGVTNEELKMAKEYIRGQSVLAMEDSGQVASWLGSQQLFQKKIKTLEESLKETDQVTIRQVNEVSKELLVGPKLNLALIGDFASPGQFLKLLKI